MKKEDALMRKAISDGIMLSQKFSAEQSVGETANTMLSPCNEVTHNYCSIETGQNIVYK